MLFLYSCTAVALPCCYSRPPPPAHSVDRAVGHAPPPSPGRPWAAVVDRPLSLTRRRSPAVARPLLLARRRRRRSDGLWPPSSIARRRPLACSPAVVRSFARRRSPATALVKNRNLLHVDFFSHPINKGFAGVGCFGPGSRRGYVGMGEDKGKPAFSHRAGPRSSRHEQKRLDDPVLLFLRNNSMYPRNVSTVLSSK